MNKYIGLDTETGGIGTNTSLLTAYLAILDEDLNVTADLDLKCKPNDGLYIVTGRAMEINGIDIKEHDKVALTYKECGQILYTFLLANKGKNQLSPIGHNVKFDILRIINHLISQGSWDTFVSYRTLDTAVIGGFAIEVGLLPPTVNAGLKSLAKYLGVGTQEDKNHEAKHDAMLSVGVYRELKKMFKMFIN